MHDTYVNFAPPPETLTTDERLAELARILATAVDRTNLRRSTSTQEIPCKTGAVHK